MMLTSGGLDAVLRVLASVSDAASRASRPLPPRRGCGLLLEAVYGVRRLPGPVDDV